MSTKTFKTGLQDIKIYINSMSDAQLLDKLYDMGFRVVPNHFIIELRNNFK